MSGKDQAGDRPLDKLLQAAHRYDFFQAVRLVEQSFPSTAPVGGLGPVDREVLRLRPRLSFAHPSADLHAAGRSNDADRIELTCQFLGIYGASSPLPAYITERLLADDEDAPLPRQVLDLLNHRLYSLLYRIWRKYRPVSGPLAHPDTTHPRRLAMLLGLEHTPTADAAPPSRSTAWLLGYAEWMVQRPASVADLRAALSRLLPEDVVEVIPCVPSWSVIPSTQRLRLGQANASLGRDTYVGELLRERSSSFRVVLSSLPYSRFLALLPGGELHAALRELVAVLVADRLDCEVELATEAQSVPPLRLGANHGGLGWTARLGGGPASPSPPPADGLPSHAHRVIYRLLRRG